MSKTLYFKMSVKGEEVYGQVDNVPDGATVKDISCGALLADADSIQEISKEEYEKEDDE